MQVEVYAGTEKVRLYLNDKLIGEMPTTAEQKRRAHFTVPYEPGTLKAVGLNGDREVAQSMLQTAGQPVSLRLTPDRTVLRTEGRISCLRLWKLWIPKDALNPMQRRK